VDKRKEREEWQQQQHCTQCALTKGRRRRKQVNDQKNEIGDGH